MNQSPKPAIVTIGNFDGVHLGHQKLIHQDLGFRPDHILTYRIDIRGPRYDDVQPVRAVVVADVPGAAVEWLLIRLQIPLPSRTTQPTAGGPGLEVVPLERGADEARAADVGVPSGQKLPHLPLRARWRRRWERRLSWATCGPRKSPGTRCATPSGFPSRTAGSASS